MNVSQVKLANEQMVLREAEAKRDEIIAKLTRIKEEISKLRRKSKEKPQITLKRQKTWQRKPAHCAKAAFGKSKAA